MLFFVPQSFANRSNHLSNAGTKWLHWTIVRVLVSAMARDINGAERIGAVLAARRVSPASFRNRRRVARAKVVVLILRFLLFSSCGKANPAGDCLAHWFFV